MSETFEDLDGVGRKRAGLLREAGYTSIEELLEAGAESLITIDGIGEATATDILASATKLLDTSKATSETAPGGTFATVAPVFKPVMYAAEPYRRVTSTETGRPMEKPKSARNQVKNKEEQPAPTATTTEVPPRNKHRGRSSPPMETRSVSGSNRETLQLASKLLARESDDDGRVGRERLRPSDFDVNLTVRFTPMSHFDGGIEFALDRGPLSAEEVNTLRKVETPLLAWASEDPANAAQLFINPVEALADVDADAAQTLAPALDAGQRVTELSPVGIHSLRVTVEEEGR